METITYRITARKNGEIKIETTTSHGVAKMKALHLRNNYWKVKVEKVTEDEPR